MSITCMPSCLSTKMFAWLFCCTISLGAYRKMFLLLLWVAERPLINWEDFEYPWLDPNSQQSYASLSLSLSLSLQFVKIRRLQFNKIFVGHNPNNNSTNSQNPKHHVLLSDSHKKCNYLFIGLFELLFRATA